MICLTGDIHRQISFSRLSLENWPEQKKLSGDDVLIILGDFGMLWYPEDVDGNEFLDELSQKPFQIAFIDGNHENHKLLNQLPISEKWGGKVGVVSDNIFHLRRGELYNIQGKSFLAMGGALSTDKEYRIIDVSWWQEEIPSYSDCQNLFDSVEKCGGMVDYIITHTAPKSIVKQIISETGLYSERIKDFTTDCLEELKHQIKFKRWFFGHFHIDIDFGKSPEEMNSGGFSAMFESIEYLA